MAEVFNIDLETGDLSQFDTVVSGTLPTFDASTLAAKTGSYGMRCIGAGYGHGQANLGSGNDDIYFGFHYFIDPDLSMNQFTIINLFYTLLSDSSNIRFSMARNTSGSGAPINWRIDDSTGNTFVSTNLTLGSWLWIEAHIKVNDGSTGGVEIWVNGNSIYSDFTQAYAQPYITDSRIGVPVISQALQNADEYLYFDNFISDNSGRVPEPTVGESLLLTPIFDGEGDISTSITILEAVLITPIFDGEGSIIATLAINEDLRLTPVFDGEGNIETTLTLIEALLLAPVFDGTGGILAALSIGVGYIAEYVIIPGEINNKVIVPGEINNKIEVSGEINNLITIPGELQ